MVEVDAGPGTDCIDPVKTGHSVDAIEDDDAKQTWGECEARKVGLLF